MMTTKINKRMDTGWYIAGWIVAVIFAAACIGHHVSGGETLNYTMPCMVHEVTGVYCPGCGGTRALVALMEARFWTSFVYHPIVMYVFCLGTWFMVSQTVERLSKGKILIALHYKDRYLWIALGIIIVNFVLKNVLKFGFGLDLLEML